MSRMTLAIIEDAMPPSLTWRQKLDAVAKAGFDALELSIKSGDNPHGDDPRLAMPYGLRRAIRDFESDAGVRIGSICISGISGLGSPEPGVRKHASEVLRAAIKLAENMGINLIGLSEPDAETEDSAKYFEESVFSAAEYAAAMGVAIALGTGTSPFMDTVSKATELVRSAALPNLGLYPDIGNLYRSMERMDGKGSPDELSRLLSADLESGRGHIFATRLKDVKIGEYDGLLPGEGRVDFGFVVAKLYELGVRRISAMQRYTPDRAGCWEEDLARTASLLRGAWSKRKVGASVRASGDLK